MGGNQNPLLLVGRLEGVGRVPTSLLKVAGRSGTGEWRVSREHGCTSAKNS